MWLVEAFLDAALAAYIHVGAAADSGKPAFIVGFGGR